jgi:CRAL/TRIO, N-terminal domain
MASSAQVENPIGPEADLEQENVDEKSEPLAPTSAHVPTLHDEVKKPAESEPLVLPFTSPSPSATKPSTPPKLTEREEHAYNHVYDHLKSITELPVSSSKKNTEKAPLSDVEQYFLSKECIVRYLRATKWNVQEAIKRLEGTIVWRREYGTDALTAETIEPEVQNVRGTRLMLGIDGKASVVGIR